VALLLESTLLSSWPSNGLRFDLVWILVLFLAFSSPLIECGLIILCLGFMEDLSGTPFIGFFATLYFFFAVLLRAFIVHMFVETLWARLLWIGIFTLFAFMAEWCLLIVIREDVSLPGYLLSYALLQAPVNMVAAAFLLPFLDRLDDWIYHAP